MKNNFTKTHLFSCPIYKIKIDPNSYDKEKIINDILYNKSLKNIRNEEHQIIGHSNDAIHHSYNDFDNEDFRKINYDKLADVYFKIFKEFLSKELYTRKEFRYKFEIVNYTAITEGQYLPSHSHLGSDDDFAAIHYLNFKDDHILTCFNNPINWAPFLHDLRPELENILNVIHPDNSYMVQNFMFPVQEDDMMIWPSALNHQIFPQGPTKEPRITISTNMKIFPTEEKNRI